MADVTEEQAASESGFVKDITKMSADFDRWYVDVVRKAELADYSPVRGCMVIRPYGYALWENIQRAFDDMIKSSGHQNMYFPLFIPRSIFMREAEHVEGFAPEVAWVTRAGSDMKELEEPLVIRPTSETIIGTVMRKYIQSYRDLPQLLNQWCNVVRWELRTRLFLRTAEFLWQEGHTFHATYDEAAKEVALILDYYRQLAEDWLAVPVDTGRKSEAEKFAGAEYTTSIEGMMRDGLALQMGTSHHLGQNFSRAFDIAFTNRDNVKELCCTTSWGISTRTIGGLIMAHGDDAGLILPPKIAPIQVAIVPIFRDEESRRRLEAYLDHTTIELRGHGVRFTIDWRDDVRPGDKYNHWELRGVPFRLEVGPREIEANQVIAVNRITRDKKPLHERNLAEEIGRELANFQRQLYDRAKRFREDNTFEVATLAELIDHFKRRNGFVWAPWCLDAECEARVKAETGGVTTRNYNPDERPTGDCLVCGRPAQVRISFARAY